MRLKMTKTDKIGAHNRCFQFLKEKEIRLLSKTFHYKTLIIILLIIRASDVGTFKLRHIWAVTMHYGSTVFIL